MNYIPQLESLEIRIVPAVRTWTGNALSWNWDSAGNWANNQVAQNGDDVVISLQQANGFGPQIPANITKTLGSVSVDATSQFNNTKEFEIFGTLVLTGDTGATSQWYAGKFDLGTAGKMVVKGNFEWRAGEIKSENGVGRVSVYQDDLNKSPAIMKIMNTAEALEAHLHIGAIDQGLAEIGPGMVELRSSMQDNLKIREDVDIYVHGFGTLKFDALPTLAGASGGIIRHSFLPESNPSGNSEIINSGVVLRPEFLDTPVFVGLPLKNDEGLLRVEGDSAIEFNAPQHSYDIEQTDGAIELHHDSDLIVPNGGVWVQSGEVIVKSNPLAVNDTANLSGQLTVEGGIVTIGDLPGKYITFFVDAFVMDGGELRMSLDGDDAANYDQIFAITSVQINTLSNNATIDITADGNVANNLTWRLIYCGPDHGNDFAGYDLNGANLNHAWDMDGLLISSPENPPDPGEGEL